MNEHGYIRSIHRKLPPSIYRWKINDNFEGGVADAYYSGNKGDLWVEYKYIKALPKRSATTIKTSLSQQQKLWLSRRSEEGRRVAVIIGSPMPYIIMSSPSDWNEQMTQADFIRRAFDKDRLVSYIIETTTR